MKKTAFANTEDMEFEKQCGEVFLTIKGNIVFQCTLCDTKHNKYDGFEDYAAHIQHIHVEANEIRYPTIWRKDIEVDPLALAEPCTQAVKEKKLKTNLMEWNKHIKEPKKSKKTVSAICAFYGDLKEQSSHQQQTTMSIPENDRTVDFGKVLESVDLQIKKKRYKRENRKYKCPHCDFAAKDNANLSCHVRRHSDFKPHKCPDCDKAFYTTSELNTHKRTHTGERPFLCTDCGRAFMTSGMLSDHVKRHKNLREKECTVCGMKFFSAKQLRAHIVIHSEDRLHKCTECNKGFKQRVALKNHMKLHANKREYQCELCCSSFNQSSGLYSHIKNKHTSVSPVSEPQHMTPNSSLNVVDNPTIIKTNELKS